MPPLLVHFIEYSLKEGRFEEVTDKYLILKIGGIIDRISLDEIASVEIKSNQIGETDKIIIGYFIGAAVVITYFVSKGYFD